MLCVKYSIVEIGPVILLTKFNEKMKKSCWWVKWEKSMMMTKIIADNWHWLKQGMFQTHICPHGAKFSVSGLTLTYEHVTWKSIGIIYSLVATPSLGLIKWYWADNIVGREEWFDLDLWTCDLKINRDHLLIEGDPCTKFGIDKWRGQKILSVHKLPNFDASLFDDFFYYNILPSNATSQCGHTFSYFLPYR